MKRIYSYRLYVEIPNLEDLLDTDVKYEFRKKFREICKGNEFGDYGDIEWCDYLSDNSATLITAIKKKDIAEAVKFLKQFGGHNFEVLRTVTTREKL